MTGVYGSGAVKGDIPVLTIGAEEGAAGQEVLVPVTAENFDGVAGFLLRVNFQNNAVLTGNATAQNLHSGLGGTITQNFTESNTLIVSWTADPDDGPVIVEDGEALFDIVFEFAGGASAIVFDENSELTQDDPPQYPVFPEVTFLDGSISTVDVVHYSLTLLDSPGETGAELTGAGSYEEGETVNINTTVPEGYLFDGWSGSPEDLALLGDPQDTGHSFEMPARHVSLTANFEQVFTISGILRYANTSGPIRPITNSTVYLKTADGETTLATTTTHETTGEYLFEDVPAGDYQLTASTTKPWGGSNAISISDYSLVRAHATSPSFSLTGLPLLAADVTNTGSVSISDYSFIRAFVLTGTKFDGWTAPNWIFQSATIEINNGNVEQDLMGIVSGDVTRTYEPPL